jgi:hypothetical protein
MELNFLNQSLATDLSCSFLGLNKTWFDKTRNGRKQKLQKLRLIAHCRQNRHDVIVKTS